MAVFCGFRMGLQEQISILMFLQVFTYGFTEGLPSSNETDAITTSILPGQLAEPWKQTELQSAEITDIHPTQSYKSIGLLSNGDMDSNGKSMKEDVYSEVSEQRNSSQVDSGLQGTDTSRPDSNQRNNNNGVYGLDTDSTMWGDVKNNTRGRNPELDESRDATAKGKWLASEGSRLPGQNSTGNEAGGALTMGVNGDGYQMDFSGVENPVDRGLLNDNRGIFSGEGEKNVSNGVMGQLPANESFNKRGGGLSSLLLGSRGPNQTLLSERGGSRMEGTFRGFISNEQIEDSQRVSQNMMEGWGGNVQGRNVEEVEESVKGDSGTNETWELFDSADHTVLLSHQNVSESNKGRMVIDDLKLNASDVKQAEENIESSSNKLYNHSTFLSQLRNSELQQYNHSLISLSDIYITDGLQNVSATSSSSNWSQEDSYLRDHSMNDTYQPEVTIDPKQLLKKHRPLSELFHIEGESHERSHMSPSVPSPHSFPTHLALDLMANSSSLHGTLPDGQGRDVLSSSIPHSGDVDLNINDTDNNNPGRASEEEVLKSNISHNTRLNSVMSNVTEWMSINARLIKELNVTVSHDGMHSQNITYKYDEEELQKNTVYTNYNITSVNNNTDYILQTDAMHTNVNKNITSLNNKLNGTLDSRYKHNVTVESTSESLNVPEFIPQVNTPRWDPTQHRNISTTTESQSQKFLYYTYKDKLEALLQGDQREGNKTGVFKATVASSVSEEVDDSNYTDWRAEIDTDENADTSGDIYEDIYYSEDEERFLTGDLDNTYEDSYGYYSDENYGNDGNTTGSVHEYDTDLQWLHHMEDFDAHLTKSENAEANQVSWPRGGRYPLLQHSFLEENSLSLMVFYTWLGVTVLMLLISYIAFRHRQRISNFITDKKLLYRRRRSTPTEEGHQLLSANPYV